MKRRAISVVWEDSMSTKGNVWNTIEHALECDDMIIYTLGYLLDETKDHLVIAGHVGGESCSGDMTIPKRCIVKRRWVRL